MPRLSINEMTTYRWSFEQDVAHFAAARIPGIGVWRQKLSDFGDEKGIELLSENGLHVSNLLWAGGFTGSDGRTFRESVEDAADAIQLAAQMNADCLVLYTGARAGHTRSHARRLCRDALERLVPLAADARVVLAIEPMREECAGDWTFLTTLEETLDLLSAFDSPWLRLVFDTYHFPLCEDDPRLVELARRIAIVHLADGKPPVENDQRRTRLGEGESPLRSTVHALLNAGYDGFFDVELFGDDIAEQNYPQLIAHSARAFDELLAHEPAAS